MKRYTQQKRYWVELVQLKSQAFYLNSYQIECEKHDSWLRMFLAIASSSSIASWVIWQQLGMVWGAIIAISHVLNVIKRFLPWERVGKELGELGLEIADVLLYAEQKWYPVASGELTEPQIHDLVIELKRRKNEAEKRHLAGRGLPVKDNHKAVAVERVETYFRIHYGIGGNNVREEQGTG